MKAILASQEFKKCLGDLVKLRDLREAAEGVLDGPAAASLEAEVKQESRTHSNGRGRRRFWAKRRSIVSSRAEVS
jgi:hypothetical protein